MAETLVCGAGAAWGAVCGFRFEEGGFRSGRGAGGSGVLQPGEPERLCAGNTRAVPLCLSLMRSLETSGARVLNGSRAFALELSKSAQGALLQKLSIAHPKSLVFNDVEAALASWQGGWPALVKPEQGGSGARMFLLEGPEDLRRLLQQQPELWWPDNLLLLQGIFRCPRGRGSCEWNS